MSIPLHMTPEAAALYLSNYVGRYAIRRSDNPFGAMVEPDRGDLIFAKSRAPHSLAPSASARKRAGDDVHLVRPFLDMIWIYAKAIVAGVHRLSIGSDSAAKFQFEHDAMSERASAFVPNLPVATARNSCRPNSTAAYIRA